MSLLYHVIKCVEIIQIFNKEGNISNVRNVLCATLYNVLFC